jgi:anti-sigma factor RsiW
MNPLDDNLQSLFDGELPEKEALELQAALQDDPALAEALASLASMEALHRDTMPAPKDADFIEQEFQSILAHLHDRSGLAANPVHSDSSHSPSKLLPFHLPNWLMGSIAAAAALAITVAGVIHWQGNQAQGPAEISQVAFVHSDIEGASSMIFMDESSGWTFVWVDVPT